MIRGQKRALDKQTSVNVNLNASIHNRFDFEVIDSKTGKIRKKAVGYNTICDGFWEKLNGLTVYYLAFGGGAGTPSPSDRELFQLIGEVNVLNSGTITDNMNQKENWYSYQIKITLSETEYVGQTFTEVGCMSSDNVLTTHAMLQDMNGNPISIQKTDTDIINIYCTLFIHWSDSYANGAIIPAFGNFPNSSFMTDFFRNNGLPYWNMYLLKGSILTAYGKDSGFIYNAGLRISYDKAKKIVTYTANRIPVEEGNSYGGTLAIGIGESLNNRYRFDLFLDCGKLLPHSIITGESVATGDGSTSDFCTKFSPAYDIEVYVDGVLSTDVTVDENVPTNFSNIMGTCFIPVPHASDQLPVKGRAEFPSLNNSEHQDKLSRLVTYNPYWEKGISTIVPHAPNTLQLKIEVSNDLLTWTTLWDGISPSPNLAIPAEYQNSKYFAFSGSNIDNIIARDIQPTNIHFASPPASGAVITANYKAKCIAKDTFHVFDFSISIQFGEYTE